MNELQKLQKELDILNEKRLAVIKGNSVKCDFQLDRKPYSYRKSISIRSL